MIFPEGVEGSDSIDDTRINSLVNKFSLNNNSINNSGCGSAFKKAGSVISRKMYEDISVCASEM